MKYTTFEWGGYNDFPPGWRKMTDAEFAKSHLLAEKPVSVETRQMVDDKHPKMVEAKLFFLYDNQGYAIGVDYWKGKVQFYHFGCDHEWGPRRNIGNCLNDYTCTKCGQVNRVDSSD